MNPNIIVISSPQSVRSENRKLVEFFELGLEQFHVRKPDFTDFDMMNYLSQIPEKYREYIQELQKRKLNTPIYAIGGIQPEDVSQILEAGVFGVAVSSVISEAKDIQGVFSQFKDALSF